MEGKSVLFHTFAGVEAFPICLATQDPDEIVAIVKRLEPTFGGVNLEDISAPRCFEIEQRLIKETSIPIFHDDQHGTAVVVLAGVLNACKVTGRALKDLSIVVNGAGASAIAVSKLLISVGVGDVILCDTTGAIYAGRPKGMNWIKDEMAAIMESPADNLTKAGQYSALVSGICIRTLTAMEFPTSVRNSQPISLFPTASCAGRAGYSSPARRTCIISKTKKRFCARCGIFSSRAEFYSPPPTRRTGGLKIFSRT